MSDKPNEHDPENQRPKMTETDAMAYIAKIHARRPSIEQIVASGGPVIPVELVWNAIKQKIEKKPLVKWRKKPPPTTADEIRRVLNSRWVRDSWTVIGRPTGAASGYDILDIDPRHGGGEWFEKNHNDIPATQTSVTGSDGAHLKFRHVDGVRNSTGDDESGIAPGIDVRGEGGYHVDWSLSGFPVLNAGIIAEWPNWLLEQVRAGGRKKAKSKTKSKARHRAESAELPPIAAAMVADINDDKEPPPYTEDNVNLIWSLLCTIPGKISRDEWLDIGRALHWLGPVWDDRALAMWHEWSAQFPEYDADGLEGQWDSFHSEDVDNPVTIGTLQHLARKYNPLVNPLKREGPAAAATQTTRQTANLLRDDYKADLGNARKLVKLCGPDVHYLSDAKIWMWWDAANGRWVLDYDGMMMRAAKYTVELMLQEAGKILDADERDKQIAHAYRSMQKARLDAMVSLASSEARVLFLASKLDADPWLAGVRGGNVIELKTGVVRKAKREDYITKQLGNFPGWTYTSDAYDFYDPAATCPKFLDFLNLIFDGDQELIPMC